MSSARKEKIICSNCGKEFEIDVWDSINATRNPQLKERLFGYSLFNNECPHCKEVTSVLYNLLYHDMKKGYMIQLENNPQMVEQQVQVMKYGAEVMRKQHGEEAMQNYYCRVVTDVNHLLEKIMIFDNDLDDRTVEMVKHYYEEVVRERHPEETFDFTLFGVVDDEFRITFVDKEKIKGYLVVDKEIYNNTDKQFFEKSRNELSKEFVVDKQWLIKYMKNHDKAIN